MVLASFSMPRQSVLIPEVRYVKVTVLPSYPKKTPRTYCAANTEDLETVIEHIQKNNEAAPIMAAGVSMGG